MNCEKLKILDRVYEDVQEKKPLKSLYNEEQTINLL